MYCGSQMRVNMGNGFGFYSEKWYKMYDKIFNKSYN